MKIGLCAIGIGLGARPEVLTETARAAERVGFATLWVGEHVALFDRPQSRYPYSPSGEFFVDSGVDWLDPLVALSFAAAATRRIRIATGICLVAEHNPLILAKQVASLDKLSGGRFVLGSGIGWSAEEFAALNIPFESRAARMRENIDAMRALWREDKASFHGKFISFDSVRSFPKPANPGGVPVIIGGESAAALKRAAEYGDGWYGLNVSHEEAAVKIATLRRMLADKGRGGNSFEIIVAPFTKPAAPEDLPKYSAAGVNELAIVASPPEREIDVARWAEKLARQWIDPAEKIG